MVIKVGEIGKQFNLNTGFDLSGNSELTLNFTDPVGAEKAFTKSGGRVTAPSVVGGPDVLMQLITLATDFDVSGTWTVYGVYEDLAPSLFEGDLTTFVVEPSNE